MINPGTSTIGELIEALSKLPVECVWDGEVVVWDHEVRRVHSMHVLESMIIDEQNETVICENVAKTVAYRINCTTLFGNDTKTREVY